MLRHMLQRGLGIAAEDRLDAQRLREEVRRASTGPRHRCRGSRRSSCGRRRARRCFNGASASLPRIARARWAAASRRTCFNGASASLPRIVASSEEVEQHQLQLQRGLGIAAEDRGQLERDHRGARRASTGPRHRCRGSRRARSWALRRGSGFNGASASLPRIVDFAALLRTDPYCASTGPRHRCRGSPCLARRWPRGRNCFNGASASLPRIDGVP